MAVRAAPGAAQPHQDRNAAITNADRSRGYGMEEVGNHFGLHYSRISRIIRKTEKAKGKTCPPFSLGNRTTNWPNLIINMKSVRKNWQRKERKRRNNNENPPKPRSNPQGIQFSPRVRGGLRQQALRSTPPDRVDAVGGGFCRPGRYRDPVRACTPYPQPSTENSCGY